MMRFVLKRTKSNERNAESERVQVGNDGRGDVSEGKEGKGVTGTD